jgi:DNA-binding MarR family transcriptional regulator
VIEGMRRLTDKQRILGYVQNYPGRTATEIAEALGLKVDSVSPVLLKAMKCGTLCRLRGDGPRKGTSRWVYYTTGYFQHPNRPTVWDHLLGEQTY